MADIKFNELNLSILETKPEILIESAQDITDTFADIGSEINLAGFKKCALYLKLDINDSTDVDIRAVSLYESGGDEYIIPNTFGSAGDYSLSDADQNIQLVFETDGITPFIKFKVKAGAVGATAGQILSAILIKGA